MTGPFTIDFPAPHRAWARENVGRRMEQGMEKWEGE